VLAPDHPPHSFTSCAIGVCHRELLAASVLATNNSR
jgi:hypothetical protein